MPALRALVSACLIGLLGACSTARIAQFDGFAAAGIKYADTIPLVFDQSFETAVKTDSLVLLETRRHLPGQKERLAAIFKPYLSRSRSSSRKR